MLQAASRNENSLRMLCHFLSDYLLSTYTGADALAVRRLHRVGRQESSQYVLFALWTHPNNPMYLRLHRNKATLAHLHYAWHFEPLQLRQFVCTSGSLNLLSERHSDDGYGKDDGYSLYSFH